MKLKSKKNRLRLSKKSNSFESKRVKIITKKKVKPKSFFERLNFVIDYIESLRAEVVLEYFKNRQFK